MNSMNVYITDRDEFQELNLVPDWTNNTLRTIDEIIEWNHGEKEDAGFHYNEDEDRWESTAENFKWWEELAEGRAKAYMVFENPAFSVDTKERNGVYWEFASWFRENSSELEDEKRMFERIPEFIQAIRDGEIESLDEEVADEIEVKYKKAISI